MLPFIILCLALVAGGALDAWLIEAFGIPLRVCCLVHGALVTLLAMDNWTLWRDLRQAQREGQFDLLDRMRLHIALLEQRNLELGSKRELNRVRSSHSWHGDAPMRTGAV